MPDQKIFGPDRFNDSERQLADQGVSSGQTGSFKSVSAGYEIRIQDHLETYWYEWFEGWTITDLENGEVLLRSSKIDQSSLHGTLNKIRDLNLTLLSVTRVTEED